MKQKILAFFLLLTLMVTFAGCSSGSGAVSSDSSDTKLASFTAKTLDGGTFTEADIAAKDLTMVNFWMTNCGPCIDEMPDLAEFEKQLPDNVQLVTACLFGEEDLQEVQGVMDASGFEGVTLVSGDGDYEALAKTIQGTPTTIFINSKGEIVGDTILGGQQDFAGTMLKAINAALEEEGKAAISLG